jgi:hypothetical protein
METRQCKNKKCLETKPLSEFGNKKNSPDGINPWCKSCNREYAKNYRKTNPDNIRKTQRSYLDKNKDKVKQWNKNHFENNKDRVRERARNNYQKYSQIPEKRIMINCRNYLVKLLKHKKSNHTEDLVGCTPKFLKEWLEYQFDSKMSWDNYGTYWHIEHVIPCASFDFSEIKQQRVCFNWRNIRPFEGSENISKGDKIIPKDILSQEIRVNYCCKLKALSTTLSE